MLRVVAVAALILAVSGCMSTASAPVHETGPSASDDGLKVTATRVEPLVHDVDQRGRIENRPCLEDDCRMPAGFSIDSPERDFGDPLALFWRVSLHADWTTKGLPNAVQMTVYATTPCGIGCVKVREVESDATGNSPGFDGLDIYLKPGETGVRVRLVVEDTTATWSEAGIDYRLHGTVSGYRAVAPPVVIS